MASHVEHPVRLVRISPETFRCWLGRALCCGSEAAMTPFSYASFGAIFLVFYAFSFWVRFGELYWLSVAELLALVVVFAGIVVGGVGTV